MDKNTAELLQELIDIKKNTRSAIEDKGVAIVGGMKTYPSAVSEISQVFAGTEIDFTRAGWLQSESDEYNRTESEYIEQALQLANYMFRNHSDFSKWEKPIYGIKQPARWNELVIAPKMYNLSGRIYQVFAYCGRLKYVPQLDTSSVTDMTHMFLDCGSLTIIPQLDTSSVTRMGGMFSGCSSLTAIPQLDTSSVTDMSSMFARCSSLTAIPQLDTSSVTDMSSMFMGCANLTSIPLLNASKVNGKYGMAIAFSYCDKLTDLGGFKDLKSTINLNDHPGLTVDSVMNVITNVYDWVKNTDGLIQSEWDTNPTISLHSNVLSQLTEEQIAIATNKGWTIN